VAFLTSWVKQGFYQFWWNSFFLSIQNPCQFRDWRKKNLPWRFDNGL